MEEDTCPDRTPAEVAAIEELGAWVDELRAGTREQAIDGIYSLLTQVRGVVEDGMAEIGEVVKNYDAKFKQFVESGPRCIHCDCAIPVDRDEHWRECPKHPARVAMIQAGNAMAMSKFLIEDLTYRIHGTRYDWNADPDEMTRRTGDVLKAVDEIREMTKVLPLADYPPAPTKPSPLEEALAPHVGSVMALIAAGDSGASWEVQQKALAAKIEKTPLAESPVSLDDDLGDVDLGPACALNGEACESCQ